MSPEPGLQCQAGQSRLYFVGCGASEPGNETSGLYIRNNNPMGVFKIHRARKRLPRGQFKG